MPAYINITRKQKQRCVWKAQYTTAHCYVEKPDNNLINDTPDILMNFQHQQQHT